MFQVRSLAEDDEVFCADTSIDIDEVCVCVVFWLNKNVQGILDGDEPDPTYIVSEVCVSLKS